jgi:predicted O-methyltransferase YrrM
VKLDRLQQLLADLRYPALTSAEEGRKLYDFVLESDAEDILELGFAHGTSSCYMAAALDERGTGRVLTIDRVSAVQREPNILRLLSHTGLGEYVEPVFANTSYNWELMKLIQDRTSGGGTEPSFDFCFIDGAHTWETDGLAFFLVDKLLRPGGWILFDDVHWTYAGSPALKDTEKVRAMPDDERTTPQVMKVLSLLAMQHPDYPELRVRGNWAWIGKATADGSRPPAAGVVERLVLPQPATAR